MKRKQHQKNTNKIHSKNYSKQANIINSKYSVFKIKLKNGNRLNKRYNNS